MLNLKLKQMLMLNSSTLQLLMLLLQHLLPTIPSLPSVKTIQRDNARKFLSKPPARCLSLTVYLSLCVCQYHAHTAPRYQDLYMTRCAMTGLSRSVFRFQPRSLSRYLWKSVARYQGKCASQYIRRSQENIVHLVMLINTLGIIEDSRAREKNIYCQLITRL